MRSKLAEKLHSAVVWLFIALFLLLTPMVIFLLITMSQSRSQAIEAVTTAYDTLLQNTLTELEGQLTQIQYFSENAVFNQSDPKIVAYAQESPDSVYALNRIYQNLSEESLRYTCLGTLFLYFPDKEIFTSYTRNTEGQDYTEGMEQYVKERMDASSLLSMAVNWEIASVDGIPCLFHMTRNNSVLAGSFIPLDVLCASLAVNGDSPGRLDIYPTDRTEEKRKSAKREELFVSVPSSHNFSLGYYIEQKKLLSGLPFVSKHTAVISILLIFSCLGLLLLVHFLIARPISRLSRAMEEIQSGNLDYRIPPVSAATEFRMLNQTFNDTMDEIRYLKIDVYEEHLKAQKFQLNLLRLQIKPHFLINSLNMVYSQIMTGHLEAARSLILYTIEYFRFMMKVGEHFVTLSDELDHISSYIQIQTLRYQENLDFHQTIDPLTRDTLIPPLLIHQFVENSIKYGLSSEQTLVVEVTAQYQEISLDPFIRITIRDNGPGFPQHVLTDLNSGTAVKAADGSRFGICSYLEQMRYLYKDISWKFSNQGGACVELLFPIVASQEDSEPGA